MTKVQRELIADLNAKFGGDLTRVVEYLFEMGTLDDCLARQHVVIVEWIKRYTTTDMLAIQVQEDIGEDYGLTRQRVHQIVSSKRATCMVSGKEDLRGEAA